MFETEFGGTYSGFVCHKKRHFSFPKFAFTLSEVLITLVIIGIVAAITIPIVYANYQKIVLKAALKKSYASLNQALDNYYLDKGRRLGGLNISLDKNPLYENLRPYLNILYDCGELRLNSLCVPMNGADPDNPSTLNTYKTYNGNTLNYNSFDDGQFVLNDGSLLLFEGFASSQERANQYISVDVNGYGKKPNRLGRDLFMFELTENGELLPMGAEGTAFYGDNIVECSNTSTLGLNGSGCTYKVLYD